MEQVSKQRGQHYLLQEAAKDPDQQAEQGQRGNGDDGLGGCIPWGRVGLHDVFLHIRTRSGCLQDLQISQRRYEFLDAQIREGDRYFLFAANYDGVDHHAHAKLGMFHALAALEEGGGF